MDLEFGRSGQRSDVVFRVKLVVAIYENMRLLLDYVLLCDTYNLLCCNVAIHMDISYN